jgi:ankyrin repeat protein
LNLGGDINARDNEGSPPLFFYLRKCNTVDCNTVDYSTADSLKNFEVLLGNADVQVRNNDGETALHVIARKEKGYIESDRELFRFMVAKGLDPLAEDGKGRSSLDVAAACGKNRILDLFQYES